MLRTIAFTGLALTALVVACDDSTGSSGAPTVTLPTLDAGPLPAPDAGPGSTCAAVSGNGTTHTTFTGNETWTAAGSPHVLATSVDIPAGVSITIEPCAVLRLGSQAGILVEGNLVAQGGEGQPVTFEALEAGKPWTTIEVRGGTGRLDLAYTNLSGGGYPSTSRPETVGMIDVRGADQEKATQPVFRARAVTITGSAASGVVLREGGGFTADSGNLTVTGSAAYPISTWARAAGTIPAGGTFKGRIYLTANGGRDDIHEDTTLKSLGAPYYVGGAELAVEDATTAPLLTIASGATIAFAKGSRLAVGGQSTRGALVADGVTFTSAETAPASGDWAGIVTYGSDSRNRIASSTIEYVGADTSASSYGCSSILGGFGNTGGVVILIPASGTPPTTAWVTGTTIRHSTGDGISRGWSGAAVDFTATNTFTDVAGCRQTNPKPDCSTACLH